MLEILFWILLILSVLAVFAPDAWPYASKGRYGVILVLIFILGLKQFGNFLNK